MITPLSVIPSRQNPTTFSADMDQLLSELPNFISQANALEQSLQLVATTGTSTTSLAIGTGSKTLTTQAGKAWVAGSFVYVVSAAGVTNLMVGQVTSYNTSTGSLTIQVQSTGGSGTFASWVIALAAIPASASAISVVDAGGLFAGANVEAVLQECMSTAAVNQTVGGVKTFSSAPLIPDASSAQNPLTLAQAKKFGSMDLYMATSQSSGTQVLFDSKNIDVNSWWNSSTKAIVIGGSPAFYNDISVTIPVYNGTGSTQNIFIELRIAGVTLDVASLSVANGTTGVAKLSYKGTSVGLLTLVSAGSFSGTFYVVGQNVGGTYSTVARFSCISLPV